MKYLRLFEEKENISEQEVLDAVENTSPEFWKMVKIANWNETIKKCREYKNMDDIYKEIKNKAAGRVYKNYEYNEVKIFNDEINKLYDVLEIYFRPYWLGENWLSDGYNVSDDGYWDLLSSIIGKGKQWVIKCIKNPRIPQKMARTRDYLENFMYIFKVDLDEYEKIRAKYDHFFRNVKKYNI